MSERKTIALAAGGTGGHMFPAQSLAEEMRQRGWKIILFSDERGLRYGEGFPADEIVKLKAASPSARGLFAKISAGFILLASILKTKSVLARKKPDVVVGFGGYPSVPTTFAARLSNIPYGLHEQNAVLGRANRLLAGKAKFIAHGFSRLDKLPKTKAHILETGNPVRAAIVAKAGQGFKVPDHDEMIEILVFGGSQGAKLFSTIIPKAIAMLPDALRVRVKMTQQARAEEEDDLRGAYDAAGVACEIAPFFSDMPERLAKAHLVIARAGASTVTEIAAIGRPSVLVPLGIAMDDHQTANAEVLVKAGAANRIGEDDFTPEKLAKIMANILEQPQKIAQMAMQAQKSAPRQAAAKLADRVEQIVQGKS